MEVDIDSIARYRSSAYHYFNIYTTVVKHLQKDNHRVPKLELPTTHLHGKDGKKGSNALYLNVQIPFTLGLKSKSVTIPVFVQPDSEQDCLLGMKIISILGIQVKHSDGTQLLSVAQITDGPTNSTISTISLHRPTVNPSLKAVSYNFSCLTWILMVTFCFNPVRSC